MMGLPDGRKSFKIGLVVLIHYRLWQTPSHPDTQTRCRSYMRYAIASRLKRLFRWVTLTSDCFKFKGVGSLLHFLQYPILCLSSVTVFLRLNFFNPSLFFVVLFEQRSARGHRRVVCVRLCSMSTVEVDLITHQSTGENWSTGDIPSWPIRIFRFSQYFIKEY